MRAQLSILVKMPQVHERMRRRMFQLRPNTGDAVFQKPGPMAAVIRLQTTAIRRPSFGPLMIPSRISPV